jgi:S-adenosylmethionine synthetase
VVDHYGPGVPIGRSLCGKDPHKVDRCGALRAWQLARNLVRDTMAREAKDTVGRLAKTKRIATR